MILIFKKYFFSLLAKGMLAARISYRERVNSLAAEECDADNARKYLYYCAFLTDKHILKGCQ